MRIPSSIRRFTDPVVGRIPVMIAGGVNRGLWWNLASAGSGYATGRRAVRQMGLIASLIRPGGVVWDVGAHHGYVTLCAARRVGPTGRVHAFEPSVRNRRLLARHVRWNRLTNVTIHPFALSSFNGEARFGGTGTSKMFSLEGGDERVPVRSADSLIDSGTCQPPTFVKVDVEGAEAEVMRGALESFGANARMLVAVHSEDVYRDCIESLDTARYDVVESQRLATCRATQWVGDPDLFCHGPGCPRREQDLELLRAAGF